MRITIIGPAYPLRGGIAHHVYWLWRELRARGHTLQIVSFKKLYPAFLFPGKTVYDESASILDASALPILDSLNPLSWRKAYDQIRKFVPDFVIIQWWNPFFAPSLGSLIRLLRRAKFPCLMECHNVLPHERSHLDSALTRFAISPLKHFITHSQKDRTHLLDFYPEAEVQVAPLPSIVEFSGEAGTLRDGRTILFFGIVRKYKGLAVLLRAMPRLLQQVDCRLLVTGEFYEPVEKYRELIHKLGIESRVTLDNRYVANEDVSGVFHQADLLVLPYISATQSAVARLALLNGLPIIASNTGGLSEVVEDGVTGFLFEPGDSEALAESIVRYFKEGWGPKFAQNIRQRCQEETPNVADVVEDIARLNFPIPEQK